MRRTAGFTFRPLLPVPARSVPRAGGSAREGSHSARLPGLTLALPIAA